MQKYKLKYLVYKALWLQKERSGMYSADELQETYEKYRAAKQEYELSENIKGKA